MSLIDRIYGRHFEPITPGTTSTPTQRRTMLATVVKNYGYPAAWVRKALTAKLPVQTAMAL